MRYFCWIDGETGSEGRSPFSPKLAQPGNGRAEFPTQVYLLPVPPGTSVLSSLNLSFPICKVELLSALPCGFESFVRLGMCVKDLTQ